MKGLQFFAWSCRAVRIVIAMSWLAAAGFSVSPLQAQTPQSAKPDKGAPASAYDHTWYLSKFWTGEYPLGIAVTGRGVVVPARAGMNKALPRNIRCELPYLANIHPWNTARQKTNRIEFWSATRIVPMRAKEAFVFEDEPKTKIQIKKGDLIEYVRYTAEGSIKVRIKGKVYDSDQNLFEQVEDVSKDKFGEEDEWFALMCRRGERAYIFVSDLSDPGTEKFLPGIARGNPSGTYGKAEDLTNAQAEEIERSR